MSKSIQLKNRNNEKMYPHPYYPVGSIYLSVVNTNPSTWFGGTWEQIAKGRTLVGVDTNDSDFNTVKKTGGAKTHLHSTQNHILNTDELPNHNHWGLYGAGGTAKRMAGWGTGTTHTGTLNEMTDMAWEDLQTGYTGGGQGHNHGNTENTSSLQPYFTCYIWCRTA